MNVLTITLARLTLLAGELGVATAASAVGDPPRQLDKRQATTVYAGIRSLLTNDGLACPNRQTPVFGSITGGAALAGGSQTTTVQFDKGGVVRIVRIWSRMPGTLPSSSVEVTCLDHVDLSQRAPDRDAATADAASSGRLIVSYAADRTQARREIIAYTRRMGFEVVYDLTRMNTIVVGAADGRSIRDRILAYQALPGVLTVQADGQAELHDRTP